ncbi:MAG: glutamate racemase [Oscillospiraceae bacterium]|nr:glutamate racemase [Oscillospiraceae bacterium]
MDTRPIGIFDSGLGGLTALRALQKELPHENIVYFADTARMPYGPRPAEELRRMARQDLDFVASKGVKAILAACGTVSSTAPDVLEGYEIRTFNVISATVREAAKHAEKPIGVIATAASIRSGGFQKALETLCPGTEIVPVACPAFVPLIESGSYDANNAELCAAVAEYLAPIRARGAGSLILGCTHYGLIEQAIRNELGEGVLIIGAADCAAHELALWLRENQLCGAAGEERFFTSGSAEEFTAHASLFLGHKPRTAVCHVPAMEV